MQENSNDQTIRTSGENMLNLTLAMEIMTSSSYLNAIVIGSNAEKRQASKVRLRLGAMWAFEFLHLVTLDWSH